MTRTGIEPVTSGNMPYALPAELSGRYLFDRSPISHCGSACGPRPRMVPEGSQGTRSSTIRQSHCFEYPAQAGSQVPGLITCRESSDDERAPQTRNSAPRRRPTHKLAPTGKMARTGIEPVTLGYMPYALPAELSGRYSYIADTH